MKDLTFFFCRAETINFIVNKCEPIKFQQVYSFIKKVFGNNVFLKIIAYCHKTN